MNFKLGKLPFKEDHRDLKLKDYIDTTVLPTPPESTNDYTTFTDWNMFLNDQLGDCAVAGPLHLLMLWLSQGGQTPNFTDANALSTYEAISGYNPDDPNSDVGCNLRDVLSYWKNTGIPDANGKIHKIGAYVLLDQTNHDEIKLGQYIFSGLNIGFNVPAYAMTQFQDGQIWDVQTKNAEIEGGHCVTPMGYGEVKVLSVTKEGVWVITWGQAQFMTWAFWDAYVDEAWCILDIEFLRNGVSPDGFNLTQLQADLNAITNSPIPTPVPNPVPVPPQPINYQQIYNNAHTVLYNTVLSASKKITALKKLIPK